MQWTSKLKTSHTWGKYHLENTLKYIEFDETPKAIGIIDFDSLIPVCETALMSLNDVLSDPQACNIACILY